MGELSKLPNVGPAIEKQLLAVGITSPEQLKEIGSREAWLRIRSIDSSACINRLFALEGAIRGVRWHALPTEDRQLLKEFYTSVTDSERT